MWERVEAGFPGHHFVLALIKSNKMVAISAPLDNAPQKFQMLALWSVWIKRSAFSWPTCNFCARNSNYLNPNYCIGIEPCKQGFSHCELWAETAIYLRHKQLISPKWMHSTCRERVYPTSRILQYFHISLRMLTGITVLTRRTHAANGKYTYSLSFIFNAVQAQHGEFGRKSQHSFTTSL